MFTARRRRRRPLLAVGALVALLLAPAVWSQMGGDGDSAAAAGGSRAPEVAATPAGTDAADADEPRRAAAVFARIEGLELRLPSDDTVLVAYHEAARPEALSLTPQGRLTANDNDTKFEAPVESGGPSYVVMSSRGRRQGATSAVDLVLRDGVEVSSPVTGTVVATTPYRLYGRHDDHRVEIRPDDEPELRVVLIHLDDVEVRPGDRVLAGVTSLAATANRFPFASHVDRFTEPDRWPHVHVEVKRGAEPTRR